MATHENLPRGKRKVSDPMDCILSGWQRESHPLNELLEARFVAQTIEPGVHLHTPQQPETAILEGGFEAGERLVVIAEAGVDRGDEYLRYVLSPAQLLQFTEDAPRLFLFSPFGKHSPQGCDHQSAVVGKHASLLERRGGLGKLSTELIGEPEIKVSGEKAGIHF